MIQEDGWGHTLPVLLGHEGAGTVERVGENVEGLAEGDRVVLGWHTACGVCASCARGVPRQCKRPPAASGGCIARDGAALTAFLRTGTFATRTVVPAVAAVRIPDELPSEQACLLGCAVATGVMSVLETARVWEGARVAVIGCGAVGLPVIQGARIARASEIRAIDIDERKLEQATHFGATHTEPGPVDFVFDVVGRARRRSSRRSAMIATGGTVVVVGLSPAGETATSICRRSSARRARVARLARRRPSAARGLPAARAVGARRQPRPRVDGDADRRARRLERRVRRDAGRPRDSNGPHAVSSTTLQRIIDGGRARSAAGVAARSGCASSLRRRDASVRARRRAAALEPARDPARRRSSATSRTPRWAVRTRRCSRKARRSRPSS